MLGIGVNVAVRVEELPAELHATAARSGSTAADVEPTLERLLAALERALALDGAALLDGLSRPRRAARAGGRVGRRSGTGRRASTARGASWSRCRAAARTALSAGEVHLSAETGLKLPSAMPNLVGNAPAPVSAAHGRGRPALPHGDAEGRGVAGART